MSDNKPKKTVTKWVNIYFVGASSQQCSLWDIPEEAREEIKESPTTTFITTEPQQIEIEDIWS